MICIGGTFEYLHKGHRALLDRAFSIGKPVCIGLTTDDFASASRKREVIPYEKRKRALESYLKEKGCSDYKIFPLDDKYGDTIEEKYTDIVVSEETVKVAEEINEIRMKNGLKPLKIHLVPHVLADDFLPISSTRIAEGEIDVGGRLLRALRVRVGSKNPNKIRAVEETISMFYEKYEIEGMAVDSGVSEQPFGEETIKGAVNRAKNAIGDADIGIGIEAGIFERDGRCFDVQYCAIIDKRGKITIGHGPGFYYPESVIKLVKDGMSISEAMREITGVEDIGYKEGAIGFLTEGKYTRKELTETAVLMAFVPRIKKELYGI